MSFDVYSTLCLFTKSNYQKSLILDNYILCIIISYISNFYTLYNFRLTCSLFYELSFKSELFCIHYYVKILEYLNHLSSTHIEENVINTSIFKCLKNTCRFNYRYFMISMVVFNNYEFALYDALISKIKSLNYFFPHHYILFKKYNVHKYHMFISDTWTHRFAIIGARLTSPDIFCEKIFDLCKSEKYFFLIEEIVINLKLNKITLHKIFKYFTKNTHLFCTIVHNDDCIYFPLARPYIHNSIDVIKNIMIYIIKSHNDFIQDLIPFNNENIVCNYDETCKVVDSTKKIYDKLISLSKNIENKNI